ncbi:hypothetical protein TrVGV298_002177 [Trichoderma virens]|nr:hypothetical protein TrVGV298_002177 [Trichoderma virens]
MSRKLLSPLLLLLSCSKIAAQAPPSGPTGQTPPAGCSARTLHVNDPPYDDYFYSDCHVDAQAVVTSPLSDSNLSIIGPRFIVAWPAGNSGICTYFQPQNGKNGTLAIELVNSTLGTPLGPINSRIRGSPNPVVGVEGVLSFNNSAELSLAILGSINNILDFIEGGSTLTPVIQRGINVTRFQNNGAQISRLWLDNVTTSTLTLVPWNNNDARVRINGTKLKFGSGFYHFSASYNYPQLKQLSPSQTLNNQSQSLVQQQPATVGSLSFLSYSEKLIAGGWGSFIYSGRDSLLTGLLLSNVLSTDAMETVIGAALERINRTDGSVCHEEQIGDYATLVNMQNGLTSTAPSCTYEMIDTDYFLLILLERYFGTAKPERIQSLLQTKAGSVNPNNKNLTWGDLSYTTASKIMNATAPFEQAQTVKNLIAFKPGENVGQWRDSKYGNANGRIPFDVNTALAPAALYAISKLANMSGIYPNNSETSDWVAIAARRAKVWEDNTLPFFQHSITTDTAVSRLEQYTHQSTFYKGPTHGDSVTKFSSNGTIIDYGLSIHSVDTPDIIPISHTDSACRHYLLNSTNDEQLTTFINATANAILRPFPAGLSTPLGLVVANPSLSNDSTLFKNFTNAAYHGTVVCGWQLAFAARGLEKQLGRCNATDGTTPPAFCNDESVYNALRDAYNKLWDQIEQNESRLESEVWSWQWHNGKNGTQKGYEAAALGGFNPPPGVAGTTESNARQLWSLAFLSVKRNKSFSSVSEQASPPK